MPQSTSDILAPARQQTERLLNDLARHDLPKTATGAKLSPEDLARGRAATAQAIRAARRLLRSIDLAGKI